MTHVPGSIVRDRTARERAFHDSRYSGDARASIDSYYSLFTASGEYYETTVCNACAGKRLLECGCGEGRFATQLARLGATVSAIDISAVALDAAHKIAASLGAPVDFRLMNAEKLEFQANSFDLVVGRSVLHHLEMETALSEIARVLRPDGKAVFLEPLGDNPVLRIIRKMTPHLRSADERPLRRSDLQAISRYFAILEARYFHFTSLLAAPLRGLPGVGPLVARLDAFDKVLFKTRLRELAWVVVLILAEPVKPTFRQEVVT